MAEPFKNLVNPALVRAAVGPLQRAWPAFDGARFVALANDGLESLELKARAMQVADALEATLPQDFGRACDVIEAALAPPDGAPDMARPGELHDGLRGWILWSAGEFVARRGLQQPERALAALHAITQRFTAEFAIRPFIVAHPDLVFATLARWSRDPSAQVRRLVSEGSRPRLPWGLRLQALVRDPAPTLPLLEALQDDESEDVRRSVANHLNDIAKDHPAIVVRWLAEHLPGASPERRRLLRHASRTLIKQGHPQVLRAWGLGQDFKGRATLRIAPARVALGGGITLTLALQSASAKAQRLAIDYAVHHVKADGRTTPKVFKGWQIELPARESLTLTKRHSLRPVTTRRYHAGRHGVAVQVNGRVVAEAAFTLTMPKDAA
ncbi:MAG: DNA alkylation repair protein [Rubrivivax sp.]|nr:DNA alkylation repair protein [Rubrivivax sp.]